MENISLQVVTSKSRSDFAEVKDFQTLYNSTEMGRFKDEVYGDNFFLSKILTKHLGKIDLLVNQMNQKSRSCSYSGSVGTSGRITYDK